MCVCTGSSHLSVCRLTYLPTYLPSITHTVQHGSADSICLSVMSLYKMQHECIVSICLSINLPVCYLPIIRLLCTYVKCNMYAWYLSIYLFIYVSIYYGYVQNAALLTFLSLFSSNALL